MYLKRDKYKQRKGKLRETSLLGMGGGKKYELIKVEGIVELGNSFETVYVILELGKDH